MIQKLTIRVTIDLIGGQSRVAERQVEIDTAGAPLDEWLESFRVQELRRVLQDEKRMSDPWTSYLDAKKHIASGYRADAIVGLAIELVSGPAVQEGQAHG